MAYQITAVSSGDASVRVLFDDGTHVLDHTFYVDDPSDPKLILARAEEEYGKFLVDVAPAAKLPKAVQDLIGKQVG